MTFLSLQTIKKNVMVRRIPCQYCKQRRRKCERLYESEPCKLCIKMKKTCISQEYIETLEEEDILKEYEDNLQFKAMNEQVQVLELELKKLEISLNKHRALVKKEPLWDIEFVNGQLILKSEINSIEEFMLYGKSVIRYLSPFSNMFKNSILKFESNNQSFVQSVMYVANCIELFESKQASSPAIISQRFTSILVDFIKPESLVDILIDNFFLCLDESALLLHEPSFREHYDKLEDPLTDPITLAICTAASIFTCRHSSFLSNEKRYFGEYFFKLTMDKLIDIFDEPEKELETLIVINLIQMFMINTLRINDCKKWAAISSILATSLKDQYPDYCKGNDSLPRKTRILYCYIHRNSIVSEYFLNIIDFITSKRNDELIFSKAQMDILPDESTSVKELLILLNHVYKLASHPVTAMILMQVRFMKAGEIAELDFEIIVQHENIITNWWYSLPDELKLSKGPYDCTKELISGTEDMRKLILVGYLYTLILSIQSCLITPLYELELENVNNTVRDRAIQLAMYSTDMVILISKKLESLENVCFSTPKLLVNSIDSIISLLEIKDPSVTKKVRARLDEYMDELTQSIPKDHYVPSNNSPFKLISNSQPGNIPSVIELYKNYSLPGEALMYDIIANTVQGSTTSIY